MLGLAFKILCFLLGIAAAAGLLILDGLRPEASGVWLTAIRAGEILCWGMILFALYECLLKKKLWAILIPKPVRALLAVLLALLLVAAALLETAVAVASGHSAYPAPDDECIVVPGDRPDPGGLSPALRHRLDAALALRRTAPHLPLLVSGESEAEAAAMKRYLLNQGVPEDQILTATEASSLRECLFRARTILDARFGAHPHRAVLVTEAHTLFRAVRIGKRAGFRITPHAPASDARDWLNHPREWFLIIRDWAAPDPVLKLR